MIRLLLVLSLVASSLCSFYIIPNAKSKDHVGHCYYDERKILLKVGETTHTENCEEISCGDDYSMTIAGCGTFSLNDPKCKRFERDLSKPYPTCCMTFICVEPVEDLLDTNQLDLIERNSLE